MKSHALTLIVLLGFANVQGSAAVDRKSIWLVQAFAPRQTSSPAFYQGRPRLTSRTEIARIAALMPNESARKTSLAVFIERTFSAHWEEALATIGVVLLDENRHPLITRMMDAKFPFSAIADLLRFQVDGIRFEDLPADLQDSVFALRDHKGRPRIDRFTLTFMTKHYEAMRRSEKSTMEDLYAVSFTRHKPAKDYINWIGEGYESGTTRPWSRARIAEVLGADTAQTIENKIQITSRRPSRRDPHGKIHMVLMDPEQLDIFKTLGLIGRSIRKVPLGTVQFAQDPFIPHAGKIFLLQNWLHLTVEEIQKWQGHPLIRIKKDLVEKVSLTLTKIGSVRERLELLARDYAIRKGWHTLSAPVAAHLFEDAYIQIHPHTVSQLNKIYLKAGYHLTLQRGTWWWTLLLEPKTPGQAVSQLRDRLNDFEAVVQVESRALLRRLDASTDDAGLAALAQAAYERIMDAWLDVYRVGNPRLSRDNFDSEFWRINPLAMRMMWLLPMLRVDLLLFSMSKDSLVNAVKGIQKRGVQLLRRITPEHIAQLAEHPNDSYLLELIGKSNRGLGRSRISRRQV